MGNIYNYSSNVFRELKLQANQHPPLIGVILILLSVPLIYAANSISLGILVFLTGVAYRFRHFTRDFTLLLPVSLYLLMALSLIWSIDISSTFQALSKESALIIIPLCFMFFPAFSKEQKQLILKYYSYGMVVFCLFWIVRAAISFLITRDSHVFFYHGLVTDDLNAIHVSIYVAVAFFYFHTKKDKTVLEFAATTILFLVIFLLSSKNIIIVFVLLLLVYYVFYSGKSRKNRVIQLSVLFLFICSLSLIGEIRNRFSIEYDTMMVDGSVNNEISQGGEKVYNVSIRQAWNQQKFQANDFFPGTAFRVYQMRIFLEMLHEDNIFWYGYGLNASYPKIKQKTLDYGLFAGDATHKGYQFKNFHNQYIQNFAELGFLGLLLLLLMLFINLKNALCYKDFVHISFAVLMISLFLTESFLWRQRGVTYFTVIYCLMNAGFEWKTPKKDKQTI